MTDLILDKNKKIVSHYEIMMIHERGGEGCEIMTFHENWRGLGAKL